MEKILVLLFLGFLNSNIGYCQLLSKPSLTVEDFEIALTNSDHLRKILKDHNFEYYTTGATKFRSPLGKITNPLLPDLRVLRSAIWEKKNQQDQAIFMVRMDEWEPNYEPYPEAIKTITIKVNRNSIYTNEMTEFLENIKKKYPNKSKRYFRNNELYQQYGDPLIVFTNGSNIEVRTEKDKTTYGLFYNVYFDLIKIN